MPKFDEAIIETPDAVDAPAVPRVSGVSPKSMSDAEAARFVRELDRDITQHGYCFLIQRHDNGAADVYVVRPLDQRNPLEMRLLDLVLAPDESAPAPQAGRSSE